MPAWAKNDLCLFCLVDGETPSSAFSIRIPLDNTVDDLKDLIKAKQSPAFNDVVASKLTLWHVSIAFGSVDRHAPIILDEHGIATELNPTDDISEVFNIPLPKKTIHVIVQRPPSDLISELEFVRYVPDDIVGQQQDRGPGVSSSHSSVSVTPVNAHWNGFLNSVLSMELESTPLYHSPQFKADRTFRPELMVHELFSNDFATCLSTGCQEVD
ncbi:hypothetical protein EDD11_000407 [Mortierella claussenii]|nr:hypothetical protein EDD11_000407 [Mortierella claussenii]